MHIHMWHSFLKHNWQCNSENQFFFLLVHWNIELCKTYFIHPKEIVEFDLSVKSARFILSDLVN